MRLPTILGLISALPLALTPKSGHAGATGAERNAASETTPEEREVLAALRKVNSYQLAHPVLDPSAAAEPLRHLWLRVTWYIGVVAAWEATGDPAFLEQSLAYGRELHWQVGEDPDGPNRLFPIQLWSELYLAKKDRAIDPTLGRLVHHAQPSDAVRIQTVVHGRPESGQPPHPLRGFALSVRLRLRCSPQSWERAVPRDDGCLL